MINPHSRRRNFLKIGIASFLTAVLSKIPGTATSQTSLEQPKGIVVHAEEGEHILTGRRKAPITIKFSREKNNVDSISFCTEDIVTGRKLRIHKHLYNDEIIFIHKGSGLFTLDEENIEVRTGTVMFIPRGMWHGLENTGSENILMTFGYSPAGFEGFFRDNGTLVGSPPNVRTEEDYAHAREKYGMVYKEQ